VEGWICGTSFRGLSVDASLCGHLHVLTALPKEEGLTAYIG
jgi:hypothetical protein